jgi:glycosyltransferase involved in cell wall biosynthesis
MPTLHDCSLITLARNGVEFTQHWLASLQAAPDLPREVFLIDNASEDETPALVERAARELRKRGVRFTTWRNEENVGCSRARNEPWQRATSRYTVFMDNDAAVCTGDWLTRLCRAMDEDPTLGILGPKMIYPFLPHPIQCAGAGLTPQGRVWFRGRGRPREDPRFCEFRTVPLLISATGRGSRQMCRMDRFGFPRTAAKQHKQVHGFQTGDIVQAVVPRGKHAGTHTGRLAVRASGRFNLTTPTGTRQGISWRHCRLLHRVDGYAYVHAGVSAAG